MFSPNRKLPDIDKNGQLTGGNKPMDPTTKRRLWTTVALTVILFVIWFGGIALAEIYRIPAIIYGILITYCVSFAALMIIYLIYNRAFVNKDVTVDMLPAEWSEEKKQAFVEDTRARAEKSRWMLMLIIPFVVVFMAEALYLFVWDGYLANLFRG
jgi:hypothetical protein